VAWLTSQRTTTDAVDLAGAARCAVLCGPEQGAQVISPYLRVARLTGTGTTRLPDWSCLRALTVIDGNVRLRGAFGELSVPRGCTAAVAAGLGTLACELDRAHAIVSSAVG
jgi:mannose-6-phosphate isomerase class I